MEAKSPSIQFRWWQPEHSGLNTGQWALDDVMVGQYENRTPLEDSFDLTVSTTQEDIRRIKPLEMYQTRLFYLKKIAYYLV